MTVAGARSVFSLIPDILLPQVGVVLEPGGVPGQLVTATTAGQLKFIDVRMLGEGSGRLGEYKVLEAHSKGNVSVIAGHPHAPLFATGTTTQVRHL